MIGCSLDGCLLKAQQKCFWAQQPFAREGHRAVIGAVNRAMGNLAIGRRNALLPAFADMNPACRGLAVAALAC